MPPARLEPTTSGLVENSPNDTLGGQLSYHQLVVGHNSYGPLSADDVIYLSIILKYKAPKFIGQYPLNVRLKFPLLSKCLKLQRLCSKSHETPQIIQLSDFPGVSARCASIYLAMTEDIEKRNLVHKLEVFFNSYILSGFKDCIVTLQMTKPFQLWSEELWITSQCIESLVSKVVSDPLKVTLSDNHPNRTGDIEEVYTMKKWWGDDLLELQIDLYWRNMAALKSCRKVPSNLIGADTGRKYRNLREVERKSPGND
ncbi:hypothetical protein Tco_0248436 [Tanacetum coccineum]